MQSDNNKKRCNILVPCYNEEMNLDELYRVLAMQEDSLCKSEAYLWEILFINDGSRDRTQEIIERLAEGDDRVHYVSLSRNFGKEAAMLAGFDYATVDCVVIMDADLQHPPHVVREMLAHWEEGYDDVYARRSSRGKESWLRKRLSLGYYHLIQKTARFDVLENVGDFRLLDRRCIEALRTMREKDRYTKGMFAWIGFNKKEVLFEQGDRVAGASSWNFLSLFSLGMSGVTSFTTFPLRISTIIGFCVSILSFVYMCAIFVKALIWGDPVAGYPTLMVTILFLGGVQLLALGIIGEYLARIFNEAKNRPVYLVDKQH